MILLFCLSVVLLSNGGSVAAPDGFVAELDTMTADDSLPVGTEDIWREMPVTVVGAEQHPFLGRLAGANGLTDGLWLHLLHHAVQNRENLRGKQKMTIVNVTQLGVRCSRSISLDMERNMKNAKSLKKSFL